VRSFKNILVTGGAGFIGSHLVMNILSEFPDAQITNLDKLTYAGNLENLTSIENHQNYTFVKGDICNLDFVKNLMDQNNYDLVVHLAAESHVDRSIENPFAFLQTNILGTANLLHSVVKLENPPLFYHVSTDEVYGSLGETGLFSETTSYDPRSPYSASKASSDHLVRAFHHTYDLPVVISNCSNNYGPYQFPEKLIPLVINNFLHKKAVPVYGDGMNIRDWLYVEDHIKAIFAIVKKGEIGETYNIGGNAESTNINIVSKIGEIIDKIESRTYNNYKEYVTFVKDRPGHDRRYAIDSSKITNELEWNPSVNMEEGLLKTINWYLSNKKWLDNVTSGDYKSYYKRQYSDIN